MVWFCKPEGRSSGSLGFGDRRFCAWPGRLEIVLDDQGGRFTLDAVAGRELDLPLPGDAARWPRAVRVEYLPSATTTAEPS
ncbi:MAG: hypothetical protein V3T72_12630 [Thermoanaerobaculia bacterium]